jgi:dihydrofolate reductase
MAATPPKPAKSPNPSAGPRKIVAQTFVSLDGVMQAPGGPDEDRDGNFKHGGWSMKYWDEKMGQLMGQRLAEPHDLLLGRKTYDIFAGYWPKHRDEPYAAPLNNATKYVASRTQRKLEWQNSHLLAGDAAKSVAQLKQQPGRPLSVMGSHNLLQTLFKNDLVDELDLWVFPVVLGTGKRLFHDGAIPTAWKLKDSNVSTTGVVIQRFQRNGAVQYGSPPGT